jgi:hypothetical protein
MDDVVAIEVVTPPQRHYFLTWGRIFDPVDGVELLATIEAHLGQVGLNKKEVTASRVCSTLQEASQALYFFEGLISFSHRPIPFGDGYELWRKKKQSQMEEGREIYYLGALL